MVVMIKSFGKNCSESYVFVKWLFMLKEEELMPTNKKESLVFTIFMCAFMVFWMSVYNVSLHMGFSNDAIKEAWLGFPIAYLFAILCDWMVVSKIAKAMAFKVVSYDSKPLVKIITISSFMVCGMVILMSLYGAIEQVGFSSNTLMIWLTNMPKNFIVALPLQLIIAGPFIRSVFKIIFTRQTA